MSHMIKSADERVEVHTPVDYLIVGNITRDTNSTGVILGGTSSYSALTACGLRQCAGIVSRVGADVPALNVLRGVSLHRIPTEHTTTFRNDYEHGVRHQKWLADGGSLSIADIPPEWHNAPIVHLAPIAQELPPSLCAAFPNSFVGVTVQGWLRGRDDKHTVRYQPHPDLMAWIGFADAVVVSLSDFWNDRVAMEQVLAAVPIGVETLGAGGCRVCCHGTETHVPVVPQPEIDPTGAGDIFAAAFFIRYVATNDCIAAAHFANACASLSVLQKGVRGVPTMEAVIAQQKQMYGE